MDFRFGIDGLGQIIDVRKKQSYQILGIEELFVL
jgi:hypothetical protein